MKLKTVEVDGKQYAEVQDGKPVYVEDDGKEIVFDAVGTRATITRLNGEASSTASGRRRPRRSQKTSKASRPGRSAQSPGNRRQPRREEAGGCRRDREGEG
ncbi:hypothetical protein ACP3P8_05935 [Pseudomonas aeruginosa]